MDIGTTRIVIFALVAVVVCGCHKQEDKSKQEASQQLQDIKAAASVANRPGEAFIVLKSDEVIYLADMQIFYFKSDFKQRFAMWKKEWDTATQNVGDGILTDNPDLEDSLKQLDSSIAKSITETNASRETMIHELESQIDDLHTEMRTNQGQDYGPYLKDKENVLSEQLETIKQGGAAADEIVEKRVGLSEYQLEEFKSQRAALIENARAEMRVEFKKRFHQMINEEAAGSIQTGSKGDFSVPAEMAYLYAERHRENGETLVWLLRIDPASAEIRMSNSNLAIAGSEFNEFWMLDWNLN